MLLSLFDLSLRKAGVLFAHAFHYFKSFAIDRKINIFKGFANKRRSTQFEPKVELKRISIWRRNQFCKQLR